MRCREFLEALSRHLDAEIDEAGRVAFLAHRDVCRSCRDQLAAHEVLERVMASVPEVSSTVSWPPPGRRGAFAPAPPNRWVTRAQALLGSAAVLALAALSLVGRGIPGADAPSPAATVATASREHAVRLGDSTFRVTVEGEATRLLSCRLSEGAGPSVEVDCARLLDRTPELPPRPSAAGVPAL